AVCNVPDYGTEAVSDHAIALALSLSRGIPVLDRGVRAGSADLAPSKPVFQSAGRVFGVLGYGAIAQAAARKAAGLGYEVLVHDTKLVPGSRTEAGHRAVDLTELLTQAQVLSLHVPLTTSTHHLLNAET